MVTATRTQDIEIPVQSNMLIVRLKDPNQPKNKKYERLVTLGKWVDIEEDKIWLALRQHRTVLWNPFTKRRQDKAVIKSSVEEEKSLFTPKE